MFNMAMSKACIMCLLSEIKMYTHFVGLGPVEIISAMSLIFAFFHVNSFQILLFYFNYFPHVNFMVSYTKMLLSLIIVGILKRELAIYKELLQTIPNNIFDMFEIKHNCQPSINNTHTFVGYC